MATGQVEVEAQEVRVVGEAASQLPLTVRAHKKATEATRMTFRYLDLRTREMQRRLRFRSALLARMRSFLGQRCAFVEVETPTLFKRTPGVSAPSPRLPPPLCNRVFRFAGCAGADRADAHARKVLHPRPESAAVQAAPHGRRPRQVLPGIPTLHIIISFYICFIIRDGILAALLR
jgi:hypothetical protein